jgi:hypothetical protein
MNNDDEVALLRLDSFVRSHDQALIDECREKKSIGGSRCSLSFLLCKVDGWVVK